MAASRRVRRGAALVAVALALMTGACGRRGRLEPAPDPEHPFTLGTPKPPPDADNKPGVPRKPKYVPIRPPHESFILDPLL